MIKQGLSFVQEMDLTIFLALKKLAQIGLIFLWEKIRVELKAITQLEKVPLAQALNYLEAHKMKVGLLINFGNTKLEFKKINLQKKLE